jgi:hypothetical protein
MKQIRQRHFITEQVLLRREDLVVNGEDGVEICFGLGNAGEVWGTEAELPSSCQWSYHADRCEEGQGKGEVLFDDKLSPNCLRRRSEMALLD